MKERPRETQRLGHRERYRLLIKSKIDKGSEGNKLANESKNDETICHEFIECRGKITRIVSHLMVQSRRVQNPCFRAYYPFQCP